MSCCKLNLQKKMKKKNTINIKTKKLALKRPTKIFISNENKHSIERAITKL